MEKIEITDSLHRMMVARFEGMQQLADLLTQRAKEYGIVGMNIASDLAQAAAREASADLKTRNIVLGMRHGFEPTKEKLFMMSNGHECYLTAEPFDLVEQAGANQ